jgi:flagellar motor component MotA
VSTTESREERAANLFDLRRIIGGLFVAWGILLTILGLLDSQEEIDRAAGININLIAGIGMLVVGIIFLAWAFSRPLGQELRESEQASRSRGTDDKGTRRPGDPGGQ